jgi:DNA-directed RNA polymerases I, II, and III subunit RPABC1
MDEITYLRNSWNTVLELIHDRNYSLDSIYNELGNEEFKYLIQNNKLNIIAKNNFNDITYVKFILTSKVKTSAIKEIAAEINEKCKDFNNINLLFILKSKPNTALMKLEKDSSLGLIQIMWCKYLQINPTKHTLVPTHTKLTSEEITSLLEKYSIKKPSQLPIILRSDPIARYYKYNVGDIIKITGSLSSSNVKYNNYRYVK